MVHQKVTELALELEFVQLDIIVQLELMLLYYVLQENTVQQQDYKLLQGIVLQGITDWKDLVLPPHLQEQWEVLVQLDLIA